MVRIQCQEYFEWMKKEWEETRGGKKRKKG
jgi:hypothetical protein